METGIQRSCPRPDDAALPLAGLRDLEVAGEQGGGFAAERRHQLATNRSYKDFA
jgi:hypothetical protein